LFILYIEILPKNCGLTENDGFRLALL